VCGKSLGKGHTSPYCYTHLVESRRKEKIQHWLETGDIGMTVNTTIRGIFREYILNEQDSCCAICGMTNMWNGKTINFILDHIDGDAANSARDNLRLICPNCDSQLPTYKSKNKNSSRTKRKEFLKDIRDFNK
jgi:hypothetical protein